MVKTGKKKKTTVLFYTLTGLLLCLSGIAVFCWYQSRPERKIARRMEKLFSRLEKNTTESELVSLATAKGLAAFFADPAEIRFMNREMILTRAELQQILFRIRKSADTIDLKTDHLQIKFPDPENPAEAILSMTVILNSDLQETFSLKDFYTVNAVVSRDPHGDYLLKSAEAELLLEP